MNNGFTPTKIDPNAESNFYFSYFPGNDTLTDYDQNLGRYTSPCGLPKYKFWYFYVLTNTWVQSDIVYSIVENDYSINFNRYDFGSADLYKPMIEAYIVDNSNPQKKSFSYIQAMQLEF